MPQDESRKRPFASISGDAFSTPVSARHAGWASDPRPIQPYQSPGFRSSYSSSSLAPRVIGPKGDASRVDGAAAAEQPPQEARVIDEAVFEL